MCLKNIIGVETITSLPIIMIAPDSYIRLTFEEFRQIPFVHLISGLDEDKPVFLQEGAVFTEMTGYTEWVGDIMPAISIGWDWMIQSTRMRDGYYKRASQPRSNLMLIDAQQRDLGLIKTATLIGSVVDEIAWQDVTQQFISTRYMP